jgi:3-deoxy-D-manno-octulosonic-acid transferase
LTRVLENVQLFLAQSEKDARRLVQMGAESDRVNVTGNLKFEVKPPAKSGLVAQFAVAVKEGEVGPVLVAGSTLEGEDAMLLETFQQVKARYPRSLLVLAPRHPERFEPVGSLLAASGIRYQRRSQWSGQIPIAGGIFLLDSIGELASLYEFSDLAFIGGSLVPRGGHNVLEAAQFGTPILVGPHTENFRDIVDTFRKADALRVVTPQSLTSTVLQLLEHREEGDALGRRAAEVLRSQRGATERTVNALLELLPESARAPVALSSEKPT